MPSNRINNKLLFLILLISCLRLSAQTLSVESFRLLQNDLTANTYGTMEYDQNGQVAALIKVSTLEKGFVFDGGMLGIVKTEQKAGEIWVYVPFGLQRITIAHPEIGVLRDYYFPVSIDRARTYEMVLKTERPEREEVSLTTNINVRFENEMNTSDIYLNGIRLASGSWQGSIAATTYIVEVKQKGYKTYTNTITLRPDDQDLVIKIPTLEPITGTVAASSDPAGAEVLIDDKLIGNTPIRKESLSLGTHTVEVRKDGYRSIKRSVYITGENTFQTVDVRLIKKEFLNQNNGYIGISYQAGHMESISGNVGFYSSNFNVEGSISFSRMSMEKVFWITSPESWSGTMTRREYDYSVPFVLQAGIGYGILLGDRFRITPQIGISNYRIKGRPINSVISDQTSYVMSGWASLKLDLCLMEHVSLMVSPLYEKAFLYGDLAKALTKNAEFVNKWANGFSVKAGVAFYF